MKYLVDTHILLWSFLETNKLSGKVKSILLDENNEIYYSPISLWEISIKYGLKKLRLKGITPEEFFKEVNNSFYVCKEINNNDIITYYQLPRHHKDPFDRFLVWEAIKNGFILLSADETMNLYKKDGLEIVS